MVIDCMSLRDRNLEDARLVEGCKAFIAMQMEPSSGSSTAPFVGACVGPTAGSSPSVGLTRWDWRPRWRSKEETRASVAEFSVGEGEIVPFRLTWHPAHIPFEPSGDPAHRRDG